jgi:periplasmic divalent cation tolerance protein
MNQTIQVQITFSSLDEAKTIVRLLVEMRLVACANLIPWVESYFYWDGKIERAQETKVLLKCKKENFKAVEGVVLEHCENEVPEILYFEIDGGHKPYLEWLEKECETLNRC